MGYLLPALTQAKFKISVTSLNERRQNYENRPYGLASLAIPTRCIRPTTRTVGQLSVPADLQAASLDDVRAFFQTYYHPANASLAIAGDVDPEVALQLAREYFEEIPPGPRPADVPAAPNRARGGRRVLDDRVELPRLYLAWLTPAMYAHGDADLDLLADVLAGGKASRLYRRLVFDDRIATDVSADQNSRELGSYFHVAATAVPGVGLDRIEAAVEEELARLVADGPSPDELARSVALAESAFVSRLQTVGGFGGKSDQLNGLPTCSLASLATSRET